MLMPIQNKEVTMSDLARMLNVSTATVSRALQNNAIVNKKTRKRVQELALSSGFRTNYFARNLRNQRTNTIGVIVPQLNNWIISAVIAGMEGIATKYGFNLIISQSSETVKKETANALTLFINRVDGLLVSTACDAINSRHFDIFLRKKIPVIFFDRVTHDEQYTKIVIDNCKAAKEATLHLISQGCKRIVHVTTKSDRSVYTDRLQGYKEALSQAGIEFDRSLLIYNNLTYDAGIEAASIIRQMQPLPDGVFVANDNCAVSCMSTLKEAGIRIPQDVAFVGFNNDPVSRVIEPNLTTINYPGYKMGEIAMRNMVNRLNHDAIAAVLHTITLQSELIIRTSSLKEKE